MGLLIIELSEVEREYNDLQAIVNQCYLDHCDDPRNSQWFQMSLTDLLTEVVRGTFRDPFGVLKDLYQYATVLINKIVSVCRLGSPPYTVMVWDQDTLAIEF